MGCIPSPRGFNIYSEEIIKEALKDRREFVKIAGQNFNNIRYVDGTALLVEMLRDLQALVNLDNEESRRRGLNIIIGKTKWILVGHINVDHSPLILYESVLNKCNVLNTSGDFGM